MFKDLYPKTAISAVDAIVRTDYVKRVLLPSEGLVWTDLMVICALDKLEQKGNMNTTLDVIARLRMNKCWVYRSLRNLQTKNLILITHRPFQPSLVCMSNWGRILLFKAE